MTDPYRRSAPTPEDPPQAPKEAELGGLRRRLRVDTKAVVRALPRWLMVPGFLLVMTWAVGGWVLLLCAFPPFLCMAIFTMPSLPAALFRTIRLHHGGVVYRQLLSSGTVLFARVDELWLEVPRGASEFQYHGVRLKEHDGTVHTLDLLWLSEPDLAALMDVTLNECSHHLLPGAQETLAAGGQLHFGDVTIDALGIEGVGMGVRGRMRWSDVRVARIHGENLELCDHDGISRFLLLRVIPHPTVLLALVRGLVPWQESPN